jgi:hypothetical protein
MLEEVKTNPEAMELTQGVHDIITSSNKDIHEGTERLIDTVKIPKDFREKILASMDNSSGEMNKNST